MIAIRPQTKHELQQAFAHLSAVELKFWLRIPPERFAQPFGMAWSPADTVRHLIKSTVPVTRALKLPKIMLRLLFGQGGGTSTPYSELVERYDAVLAAGGKAGRFSPSPHHPLPGDLARNPKELVAQCQSAVEALASALNSWTEEELDHRRLPHPLLHKITVREMLFFTLYHYEHHAAIIAERLDSFDGSTR